MLIGLAIGVAAACMIGLSAQAVVSRASCSSNPVLVNVAVSDDITPAIQTIARGFNNENRRADGRCVQVQVTEGDSAAVAGEIDGQARQAALAGIDAWIPDSSLWLAVVRSYPAGAQAVQPLGISVAKSPLMIVTTQTVAGKAFNVPVGWSMLLPPSYGGPPASLGLTVDLPDPAESAAGLAALIEVTRQLSAGPEASTEGSAFTAFVNQAETTQDTDSAQALETFVSSTAALGRDAVTVASEQAVLAYDKANPATPLVARYPSGTTSALGSPELDYPYVLTTSSPAEVKAATEFGRFLQTPYAQSVIRYNGFRSANGVPDAMPASAGLDTQQLQPAAAFDADNAATTLQAWQKLSLGSRDLVLTDVSPAMNRPDGYGTQTLEQELSLTSIGGLSLFPHSTHMGMWVMGQSQSASQPYDQLVPLGGLTADVGLIPRTDQLYEIDKTLTTNPHGNLLLYDAILAAYEDMTSSYAPNDVNAVLVLTAGVDGAHDMPLSELLAKLKALYNPNRKVEIVALMFGTYGNFKALQQIAGATGGVAYKIATPAQVRQIFIEAWSHRLCNQGCAAP